jgi:predicted RNA binding protein YcfA (HicA-like mRNA interferase family)
VHKLPVVSGEKIIKYLYKTRGFISTRTKGSHVILKTPDGITVVVPLHKELDRGTLSNILLRAGISTDEFIEEWKRYK